ncbi:MAG: glycosyltransferase [Hyphomicrobiales bacterium]|nr:glycosyltransferase [Hyphomicrobiales bacterium]
MTSPNATDALLQKAREAASRQNIDEAIARAHAAAQADPSRADVWKFLGTLHFRRGAHGEASEAFRNALRANPGDNALFHDLGVVLKLDGRIGEAEAMLRESLRRTPGFVGSVISLGDVLKSAGRHADAEQVYREAMARIPADFGPLRELANLLLEKGRAAEAVEAAQQFMQRNGQSIDALETLSVCLQVLDKLDDALAITSATIERHPPATLDIRLASFASLSGRLARLDQRERARSLIVANIEQSLPENNRARWTNNDLNALRRLSFLCPYYAIEDRLLMRVFNAIGDMTAARIPKLVAGKHEASERLRVGFVSHNFSEHPIGHLLSPFFEAHGQTGADLYLYALHINSHDPNDYAGRIKATTPHYRDCRGMSAGQLARKISADNISILIDLDGYLGGGMPEAFAMRPAPVQIHWLQHLAGMPAPYIDYTIVDRILVRDSERDNGNGPLIRLADAFQCGDRVKLPDHPPRRADHGLPEGAVVFCAFGNWLKIDEDVFACWLEILDAVPGSILWLTDGPSATSRDILRARFAAHGLAPERLIFAARIGSKAQHLNRHKCADLFLDTFTFSAATTTTDALWAGLPVLTCPGSTAQSRLSESLLRAVGVTETIVPDKRAYVDSAIRWAKEPNTLARLRVELENALPHSRLYDADRMVKQFADIYTTVSERHSKGLAPAHFDLKI